MLNAHLSEGVAGHGGLGRRHQEPVAEDAHEVGNAAAMPEQAVVARRRELGTLLLARLTQLEDTQHLRCIALF